MTQDMMPGPLPYLQAVGGVQMPPIGIGTYELRGEACQRAVAAALRVGFRLIDTAAGYHNETYVGAAIAASHLPRQELCVIIKIAPKAMRASGAVENCIRESVRRLQIHYADVVLIHWPGCGGRRVEAAAEHQAARQRCWEVMKSLQTEGIVHHLGVSNFAPRHFNSLDKDMNVLFDHHNVSRPTVNQIELHPLCIQRDVCEYCRERGMILQQYSPLGQCNSKLLEHPILCDIVKNKFHDFTVCDVLLMWGLSQGFCVLVRSRSEEHLKQNWEAAKAFFTKGVLSEEQINELKNLRESMQISEDHHFCWHSESID